jgi:hypothetical protein
MTENKLLYGILYTPLKEINEFFCSPEYMFLVKNFHGITVNNLEDLSREIINRPKQCLVYLTGCIYQDLRDYIIDVKKNSKEKAVFCIVENFFKLNEEYSDILAYCTKATIGQVPINVHNVGILFPSFFESGNSENPHFFKNIQKYHNFQELTESNKEGVALRKGIYLSNMDLMKHDPNNDNPIIFNLLRCSSNLKGPTDHFNYYDEKILKETNMVIPFFFSQDVKMNHVLAQIYYNKGSDKNKETKASIKRHSDKTKDMPKNGLIGFATFYNLDELENNTVKCVKKEGDPHNVYYKGKKGTNKKPGLSVLTQLEFRLKTPTKYPSLSPKFRINLYPNSLLLISLETNRLYTHEIKPPVLPAEKIPTRLGYVMRCSKTRAVFRDGKTYILECCDEKELKPMTDQEREKVKELYRRENTTDEHITYPPIYSSFNDGDYMRPAFEAHF